MKTVICPASGHHVVETKATSEFILEVQNGHGEIPWSVGGKTDPWDHIESAMGLATGGLTRQAEDAYRWSCRTQEDDGSWWSEYHNGVPKGDAYKDPNMSAYLAVGVLHHYLITEDISFLEKMWPTVTRAIDFVISLQEPEGSVLWAKRRDGSVAREALLTGCSSIFLSLSCALRIAAVLGEIRSAWELARWKLGEAIRHKDHLFDQTKARFSMDWYYPILCGAVTGREAEERIQRGWDEFAVPGWGIRCVSDRDWVTMAETAELVVALAAMGWTNRAAEVFSWIRDKKYDNGAYWTGVTFPDGTIYTEEQTAWTGAAVLLAADILEDLTAASCLFQHDFWRPFPFAKGAGRVDRAKSDVRKLAGEARGTAPLQDS